MRIAMIGQKGIPTRFGGVERHVESLAVRLGRLGHEVTVYTRNWYAPAQDNFSDGVRTIATPSIKTKNLDAITHTFSSTIHAMLSRVDIIHYHGVGPSLLAWIPRLFTPRIRVIATFHSIDRKHQKWGPIARTFLSLGELAACRLPHETIVISNGLRAYCFDRYNCNARYIPNGVDTPRENIDHETLSQFGLKPNGYLVTSGRLIRLKGIHHLIKAYRKLKSENGHGALKLVIIGGASYSDDYVTELKSLAGADQDIVFTGFRQGQELEELLANAYAAIHPSETEGLSLSVLEEMSHGKTVLASDIPGNIEALGRHGLTFRSRDVADLTKRLEKLIDDRATTESIGSSAKRHVLTHYNWDEIAVNTDELYRKTAAVVPNPITQKTAQTSIK